MRSIRKRLHAACESSTLVGTGISRRSLALFDRTLTGPRILIARQCQFAEPFT